jgi:hypothetical protein
MKHSIGARFVFITAGSLLTACGPGTLNGPPGTGNSCGLPPVQLNVLFPIPNARRAPRNLRTVYVSTNGHLPNANAYNFSLVQTNGSSTATSPFFGVSKSQIPTPHATPPYANAIFYGTSIPSNYRIGRNQSVNLRWNLPRSGCTPNRVVSSFRTR